MKKKFHFILALIIIPNLVIYSCFNSSTQKDEEYVSILKFTTHPALDKLESGFTTRLNTLIELDTVLNNIAIRKYDANRDPQRAKSIAESICSDSKNKLILAIATPAAIAISTTPSSIPFIYGAVADPIGAKIIPAKENPKRTTGIQNAGPNIIRIAITFINKAFPSTKKIGTLYNPAEQNSVYVQSLIASYCDTFDIRLIQRPINDPSQVSSITEALTNEVDLIYSANDNTVNSSIGSIVAICNLKKKPFIIGDLSTLQDGPLFAIGLEYKSMGQSLADIAYEILKGKSILDFKPQPPPEPEVWLNVSTYKTLEILITDSIDSLIDKKIY